MYDIEAMQKGIPEEHIDPKKPWVDSAPKLPDFLQYGTLTELTDALIRLDVPEPWATAAVVSVPMEMLLMRGIQWMLTINGGGDETPQD